MKKLNLSKIQSYLNIALMVLLAVMVISSVLFPSLANDFDPTKVVANDSVPGQDQIQTLGGGLVGILQTVGIVLSVIVLIVLGIKYMMASPEQKSDYKATLVPYVVGAGLIFAASLVANVVYQFFVGLNTGS